MTLQVPIGIDDFRSVREQRLEYIDKSQLIAELIDKEGVQVALLPRPRRFGKSINLSMLRWFFEKRDEDLWHLFQDLRIARSGEPYRAHFQRYPVVYVTFKGTKAARFEVCWSSIQRTIRALYREYAALLEHPALNVWEKADLRAVLDGTADEALYRRSLLHLTECLHRAHDERVVVLIDEYDAPIHSGYVHGYYEQVVDFFRSFLDAGLKGNAHLYKGVITGILRVAKESVFSGLNNLGVYTLLSEDFHTCFGFTEAEVAMLLEKADLSDVLDPVRAYYNGYLFGGEAIYNPWSILNFVASRDKLLRPYWLTTSSNDLVKSLLVQHAFAVQKDMEVLLEGGSIEKKIDENIVFAELGENEEALWSLLVFSGYLKAAPGQAGVGEAEPPHRLSIPNREVAEVYRTTFQSWMDKGLKAQGGTFKGLLDALLHGKADTLEKQLQALAMYLVSYHDVGASEPERFYQGLMIGLLAGLEPYYEVRSNRESGEGRADVLVKPRYKGKPGVVMELKAVKPSHRTPEKILRQALDQIHARGYGAELAAAGVAPVHAFAVAFDGKRVWVRAGDALTSEKSKSCKSRKKIRR